MNALAEFGQKFKDAHESLKKESRVLRMARALDQKMSMEQVGELMGDLLKNTETGDLAKVRLLKMAQELAQAADSTNKEHDLAKVQLEDLHAAMFTSALETLRNDEGFFLSVVGEILMEKPHLWGEIQEMEPKLIEVQVDAD